MTREQISERVSVKTTPLELSPNSGSEEAPEQDTTGQVKTTQQGENQSQENRSQETNPIINTNPDPVMPRDI